MCFLVLSVLKSYRRKMKKRVRAYSKTVRKTVRKTAAKRSPVLAVPEMAPLRVMQPFVMRYYELVSRATSTSAPAVLVYALNGCYDPDITFSGHQPRGFDQLMTLYTKYCVTKASIKVSASSYANYPSIVGVHITNTLTPATTLYNYMEGANTIYKIQGYAGAPEAEVSMTVDIAQYLGKKEKYDDSLQGTASGNPEDILYAHVFVHALDGQTTWTPYISTQITFEGMLSEQSVPSIS